MPLNQATRDDHPLALAVGLQIDRVADFLQRFGLGGFQKAARVDDDRIGFAGIRGDRQPVLREQAEHALAVHKVLGTAKADEGDGMNDVFLCAHGKPATG